MPWVEGFWLPLSINRTPLRIFPTQPNEGKWSQTKSRIEGFSFFKISFIFDDSFFPDGIQIFKSSYLFFNNHLVYLKQNACLFTVMVNTWVKTLDLWKKVDSFWAIELFLGYEIPMNSSGPGFTRFFSVSIQKFSWVTVICFCVSSQIHQMSLPTVLFASSADFFQLPFLPAFLLSGLSCLSFPH